MFPCWFGGGREGGRGHVYIDPFDQDLIKRGLDMVWHGQDARTYMAFLDGDFAARRQVKRRRIQTLPLTLDVDGASDVEVLQQPDSPAALELDIEAWGGDEMDFFAPGGDGGGASPGGGGDVTPGGTPEGGDVIPGGGDVTPGGGDVTPDVGGADDELPPAPPPVHLPPPDVLAVAHPFALEIMANAFGVFHLTEKRKAGARVLLPRAFQVTCPFHKINDKSGCKKMLTAASISEEHEAQVLRRLFSWCLRYRHHDRQRNHLPDLPSLEECPEPLVLQALVEGVEAPALPVMTDVQLDLELAVAAADEGGGPPGGPGGGRRGGRGRGRGRGRDHAAVEAVPVEVAAAVGPAAAGASPDCAEDSSSSSSSSGSD